MSDVITKKDLEVAKNSDRVVSMSHTIEGNIIIDGFGRALIDTKCKTVEEHMLSPVEPGEERRMCLKYIEDYLAPYKGQRMKVTITVAVPGDVGL